VLSLSLLASTDPIGYRWSVIFLGRKRHAELVPNALAQSSETLCFRIRRCQRPGLQSRSAVSGGRCNAMSTEVRHHMDVVYTARKFHSVLLLYYYCILVPALTSPTPPITPSSANLQGHQHDHGYAPYTGMRYRGGICSESCRATGLKKKLDLSPEQWYTVRCSSSIRAEVRQWHTVRCGNLFASIICSIALPVSSPRHDFSTASWKRMHQTTPWFLEAYAPDHPLVILSPSSSSSLLLLYRYHRQPHPPIRLHLRLHLGHLFQPNFRPSISYYAYVIRSAGF
jgi:hypothetical protein